MEMPLRSNVVGRTFQRDSPERTYVPDFVSIVFRDAGKRGAAAGAGG